MPEPLRPFVLLHHLLPDSQHWDLCLDQGPTLATWQLVACPTSVSPGNHTATAPSTALREIPVRRIADHRRAYLEYEGPISDGRGTVARIDHGFYELLDYQPDRWVVRLAGTLLIGTYELTTIGEDGRLVRLD